MGTFLYLLRRLLSSTHVIDVVASYWKGKREKCQKSELRPATFRPCLLREDPVKSPIADRELKERQLLARGESQGLGRHTKIAVIKGSFWQRQCQKA